MVEVIRPTAVNCKMLVATVIFGGQTVGIIQVLGGGHACEREDNIFAVAVWFSFQIVEQICG